ncbi:MAG: hypothetical protein ACRD3T_07600 [Terriglobia bacterium]
MSHWYKSAFLEEEIDLLVKHFGIERVRRALAKVSIEVDEKPRVVSREGAPRGKRPIRANGANALESIRQAHPEKHRLLSDFLLRLKDRDILPESQDIRYFAQMIGLKEINGKSREDMLPKLIRFLMEEPIEKLRVDVEGAANISEQQRKMGFSVLTDKLLGKS